MFAGNIHDDGKMMVSQRVKRDPGKNPQIVGFELTNPCPLPVGRVKSTRWLLDEPDYPSGGSSLGDFVSNS
jgi:hypothetical protein